MTTVCGARHYNYFRDYDPSLGRYLESDPIGLIGGLNPYIYVGGSPLGGYDPRGLKQFSDECTGRYSSCKAGQDPNASTIGNWLRWKGCKKVIDNACEKAPVVCCQSDRMDCLGGLSPDGADAMTPEQVKKVAECNAAFASCTFRAGKK